MAAKYVTTQELRWQLNLASDEGEEALLQMQCDAAETSVLNLLNRGVYDSQEDLDAAVAAGDDDGTGMVFHDGLKIAVLMMAATFDQNREFNSGGVMVYKVPNTIEIILNPYIMPRGLDYVD